MLDCIIAATPLYLNLPLITKIYKIQARQNRKTVWQEKPRFCVGDSADIYAVKFYCADG